VGRPRHALEGDDRAQQDEPAAPARREAGARLRAPARPRDDLATARGPAGLSSATAGLDVGLLVVAAGFGTSGPLLDSRLAVEEELLAVNCAAVLGRWPGR